MCSASQDTWAQLFSQHHFAVHEDCPLRGKRILICVCSHFDVQSAPDMWQSRRVLMHDKINVDLRDRAHLLHLARVSGKHDGRNIKLLRAALAAEYFDSLQIERILYRLCQPCVGPDEFFGITVTCQHGRHRSVSSSGILSFVLKFLGATVTVIGNTGLNESPNRYRFCSCHCCCGVQFPATSELEPVLEYALEAFIKFLRAVPPNERDESFSRATDLFECLDFR